jgi:hypothetical protein
MKVIMSLLTLAFFASCHEKKPFFEKDEVFAARYGLGSVGSMGFWLYNDHRYRILSSGGIGGQYYSGKYSLNKDTIILDDLDKSCGLQHNRLLVDRKPGLVFQLDERNNSLREKVIVLEIAMDSLTLKFISSKTDAQ